MVNSTTEQMGTAQAMKRKGGSFVKAIGTALTAADPINATKLLEAFPEYFKQYRTIAERENWYLDE